MTCCLFICLLHFVLLFESFTDVEVNCLSQFHVWKYDMLLVVSLARFVTLCLSCRHASRAFFVLLRILYLSVMQ